MTSITSEQFITQMKLRELRAQRDQLQSAYAAMSVRDAQTASDGERVAQLYAGLRALTFAGQPFHPEIANLQPLLHEMTTGRAVPETVVFWRERLQRELERGRLRADAVFVFGALLEEWAERRTTLPLRAQQAEVTATLYERTLEPGMTSDPAGLFDTLFAAFGLTHDELAAQMHQAITTILPTRVDPDEAGYVLQQLRTEPSRSAALREEAARVSESDLLRREFADALTLLIEQRNAWDWPASGVPAQARWSRTKWRLFLDDDLPTACLLEVLGMRWQQLFQHVLGDLHQRRAARLRRLEELHVPDAILANERRLLAVSRGVHTELAHDIWATDRAGASGPEQPLSWEYGSVFARRAQALRELRDTWEREGYGGEQYASVMPQALALINAEIALGRAAFPDRPMYIIKLDVQDYYPSLSHDLLLDLLARFGVPAAERAFFQRYLRVPLRYDDGARRSLRGLPNKRRLSDMLGELVLRLLELHVQRAARVLIVRVMDDICLLASSVEEATRAWGAAQAFCAACGLTLNPTKCGTVCVGGERPATLPSGQLTWQLLVLDADGQWRVHEPMLEQFLAQTRWRVAQAAAVLSKIEIYNEQLAILISLLGLPAPLGPAHRASIDAALARFRAEVFNDRQATVDAVQTLVRTRFLEARADVSLPEAWVSWPMTAGGLGLRQATIVAQPYAMALAQRTAVDVPDERPVDWQRQPNAWAAFYASHLVEITPVAPEERAVMETLVTDFIARGTEISSGKQHDLSTYWRWILYTYGPQILERFGTFRFLETTLVPQQLIVERQLGDTEASVLLTLAPAD
jgi:hypothetical protein